MGKGSGAKKGRVLGHRALKRGPCLEQAEEMKVWISPWLNIRMEMGGRLASALQAYCISRILELQSENGLQGSSSQTPIP